MSSTITDIEIRVAASIISKYYQAADTASKEKAKEELKKIMVVFNKLYTIAKEFKAVEEDLEESKGKDE